MEATDLITNVSKLHIDDALPEERPCQPLAKHALIAFFQEYQVDF